MMDDLLFMDLAYEDRDLFNDSSLNYGESLNQYELFASHNQRESSPTTQRHQVLREFGALPLESRSTSDKQDPTVAIRQRLLFEADEALAQLEICYATVQRHHPELLRPRSDGSLANLDLARHYLREALARDLPQVLSDNASAKAMPQWSITPKREPRFSSMSESTDQSTSESQHSDLHGSHRVRAALNNNRTRAPQPDATSVRVGKVPASLSNTGATTMMYQFDLKAKNKKKRRRGVSKTEEAVSTEPSSSKHGMEGFDILFPLGVGTYGTVRLCRYVPTQQVVCVKVLSKQLLYKLKQVDHVRNEKRVLQSISHAGVVKCFGTSNDRLSLFIVLEYVSGGELFQYIRGMGRFPLSVAKFYAAELLITLDYLHGKGIVYRDLKPENILLDENGHTKLTDFGFSKVLNGEKTWTMCGTPDYIAPEVIACTGHSVTVDWWSFGVLIFEMLSGFPPFTDQNTLLMFAKIKEPHKIQYPPTMAPDAVDLVQRLLVADPSRRLGGMLGGVQDIVNHAWFFGTDWRALTERSGVGPLRPATRNLDELARRAGTNATYQPKDHCIAVPQEVQKFFDTF